jgi:hypothetical protein
MGISGRVVQVQNPELHGYVLGEECPALSLFQLLMTFGRRKLGLRAHFGIKAERMM